MQAEMRTIAERMDVHFFIQDSVELFGFNSDIGCKVHGYLQKNLAGA